MNKDKKAKAVRAKDWQNKDVHERARTIARRLLARPPQPRKRVVRTSE